MRYVVGIPVILFVVLLAVGALTGRVRARSCCATPDASKDLRMRGATPPAPRL